LPVCIIAMLTTSCHHRCISDFLQEDFCLLFTTVTASCAVVSTAATAVATTCLLLLQFPFLSCHLFMYPLLSASLCGRLPMVLELPRGFMATAPAWGCACTVAITLGWLLIFYGRYPCWLPLYSPGGYCYFPMPFLQKWLLQHQDTWFASKKESLCIVVMLLTSHTCAATGQQSNAINATSPFCCCSCHRLIVTFHLLFLARRHDQAASPKTAAVTLPSPTPMLSRRFILQPKGFPLQCHLPWRCCIQTTVLLHFGHQLATCFLQKWLLQCCHCAATPPLCCNAATVPQRRNAATVPQRCRGAAPSKSLCAMECCRMTSTCDLRPLPN